MDANPRPLPAGLYVTLADTPNGVVGAVRTVEGGAILWESSPIAWTFPDDLNLAREVATMAARLWAFNYAGEEPCNRCDGAEGGCPWCAGTGAEPPYPTPTTKAPLRQARGTGAPPPEATNPTTADAETDAGQIDAPPAPNSPPVGPAEGGAPMAHAPAGSALLSNARATLDRIALRSAPATGVTVALAVGPLLAVVEFLAGELVSMRTSPEARAAQREAGRRGPVPKGAGLDAEWCDDCGEPRRSFCPVPRDPP
jgi:hypothetical protein